MTPDFEALLKRYGELDALIDQACAALVSDPNEGIRIAAGIVAKSMVLDRELDALMPEARDDLMLRRMQRKAADLEQRIAELPS